MDGDRFHLDAAPLDRGGSVYVHSSNRPELNLVVRVRSSTDEKADEIVEELNALTGGNDRNGQPEGAIVFMPYTGGDPDLLPGH